MDGGGTTVRRTRWRAAATALAIMGTLGLAACQPPPPSFTVNSTAAAPDANPGNGKCRTAAGECTIQAAIDEANALRAGIVILPNALLGPYEGFPAVAAEITGAVTVRQLEAPTGAITSIDAIDIHVAVGGHLTLESVGSPFTSLVIDGHLTAVRAGAFGSPAVRIGPTGVATIDRSGLRTLIAAEPIGAAVVNDGQLLLSRSTVVRGSDATATPAIRTGSTGTSTLTMTAIRSLPGGAPLCDGTTPTSAGFNVALDASCGLDEPTDLVVPNLGYGYTPVAGEPTIDRIPLGSPGCPGNDTDVLGRLRGVDGDGNGVPGCDIGGAERPAP